MLILILSKSDCLNIKNLNFNEIDCFNIKIFDFTKTITGTTGRREAKNLRLYFYVFDFWDSREGGSEKNLRLYFCVFNKNKNFKNNNI